MGDSESSQDRLHQLELEVQALRQSNKLLQTQLRKAEFELELKQSPPEEPLPKLPKTDEKCANCIKLTEMNFAQENWMHEAKQRLRNMDQLYHQIAQLQHSIQIQHQLVGLLQESLATKTTQLDRYTLLTKEWDSKLRGIEMQYMLERKLMDEAKVFTLPGKTISAVRRSE